MNLRNIDPTGTTTLRKQFASAMNGKYDILKAEASRSCDAFELKRYALPVGSLTDPPYTVTEQEEAYISWYEEQQEEILLAVTGGAIWYESYIKRAYLKGMRDAWKDLKKNQKDTDLNITKEDLDVAIELPNNKNKLAIINSRIVQNMNGITMDERVELSRVLFEGLSKGLSAKVLAKEIVTKIDSVGAYRANLLARTEIIRTHHSAKVEQYRQYGINKLKIIVEWIATLDSRTCPICKKLDGKEFTLKEVEFMIPVHPLCRCTIAIAE